LGVVLLLPVAKYIWIRPGVNGPSRRRRRRISSSSEELLVLKWSVGGGGGVRRQCVNICVPRAATTSNQLGKEGNRGRDTHTHRAAAGRITSSSGPSAVSFSFVFGSADGRLPSIIGLCETTGLVSPRTEIGDRIGMQRRPSWPLGPVFVICHGSFGFRRRGFMLFVGAPSWIFRRRGFLAALVGPPKMSHGSKLGKSRPKRIDPHEVAQRSEPFYGDDMTP
jgi:hypothetical protein